MPSRRSDADPGADRAGHRRQRLGARGEQLAAEWYVERGYHVVARNWRCPDGEIDLVAARDGLLVFCEVKTRTSSRFGLPAEAVTAAKQRRLRALAVRYLAEQAAGGGVAARHGAARGVTDRAGVGLRFDVAAVMGGRVEVIEAAF